MDTTATDTTQAPEPGEKETEYAITVAMAETFGFELVDTSASNYEGFARCRICGRRQLRAYVGQEFNERMIQHAARHGIGHGLLPNA